MLKVFTFRYFSFKEQAGIVSERFRTRPEDPLELAVFWTEYIIKFKGAPFLRLVSRELGFFEYYSLDVIFFLSSILFTVAIIIYMVIKSIYVRCINSFKNQVKQD